MAKNSGGHATLTPREGTYLVGVANFLGLVAAVFIVKRFKRRSLLIPGHIMMGVFHLMVGTFAATG